MEVDGQGHNGRCVLGVGAVGEGGGGAVRKYTTVLFTNMYCCNQFTGVKIRRKKIREITWYSYMYKSVLSSCWSYAHFPNYMHGQK